MENISSQVNQVNVSIAALTDRIRKSLNGVDRAYFDIRERMSAIRQLSNVDGQTELNKLSDFLNRKIDDIAGDIKEASISSLRANKERLENLHGIARDTLNGSQQGKGVYDQYQILVKKLDEEIKTRKKIVFRMEDFLKKNGIDTISVISALTTRNPLVGLAVKYVLERRKAAKEKEANERSLDTKDSIAYRELLMKQRDNLINPVEDTETTPKRKKRKKKAIAKNTVEIDSEETEPAQKGRRRKPAHHAKKPSMPHIIDADFEMIYDQTDKTAPEEKVKKEKPFAIGTNGEPISEEEWKRRRKAYQKKWRDIFDKRSKNSQTRSVGIPPSLWNQSSKDDVGSIPKMLSPGNYAMPEVKYGGPKALLPESSGTRMHNKMDFNPSQLGFIHDLINESGGNTIFGRKELQDKNREKRGKAAAPDFIVKNLNAKTPEKGKYDLGKLLPMDQSLVPSNKDDKFLHAIAALNLSTIQVYTDLEKFHKEDHLFDEKKAEDAEQDHLAKIAQDQKFLETLKEMGSGSPGALVHQPKDKKGHPIVDSVIGRSEERVLEKLAPKILKFLPGAGLLKRFMPTLGKTAPGAVAAGEVAGEAAETGGAVAAKTGGSMIGRLAGPILGFAIDGILGMFKSEDWNTSKTSAALGGLFAGTFNNKIINVFSQMGKYAALGASVGSVVPGFGTLAGGIIGAALGVVMGVIGGENIANFAEKTGIGRYVSSFFGMIGSLIMAPIKHVWESLKDVASVFKFLWKATSSIFTLIMTPLVDMFKKSVEPLLPTIQPIIKGIENTIHGFLNIFSDIFDWISNLSKSNDEAMEKSKAQSGKLFENLLSGFQKTLLDMITGILDSIPSWVPGSKALKELANGYRKESEALGKKTSSPTAINPSAAPASAPTTMPASASTSTPGTPSKTGYLPQSPKIDGDVNTQPATTPGTTRPAPPSPPKATIPIPANAPKFGTVAPKPVLGGIGSLAMKGETGKFTGDPGIVNRSSASSDAGGFSYGSFQIETKGGTFAAYMKFLEKNYPEIARVLNAAGGVSAAMRGDKNFEAAWKSLAKSNSEMFQKSQQDFIIQNHYQPQLNKLKGSGIDLSGRSEKVQRVIFATANAEGANTHTIINALKGKNVTKMSDDDIINAIYDYKSDHLKQTYAASPKLLPGLEKRYGPNGTERKLALETPPPAALAVNRPSQGSDLLQMISQNENAKADMNSKSGSAPLVIAPSQNTSNSTSMFASQPNPRNTDSTFRDTRFRTAYSA